jgi:hypothetical protein
MPRHELPLVHVAMWSRSNKIGGCPQGLSPSTKFVELGYSCQRLHSRGRHMIRVIIDTVLFSCMGAFITGIVVAAATFIG